jgi:hypothetical protein
MRLIPLLLAALALSACNQVYSRQPLFPEAHEGGDPEFRPGLWSISGYNENCAFDIRKPLKDWPGCAVGLEFRRGQMFLVTGHDRALGLTIRLVPGDPVVLQGHWHTDVLKDPRAPEPKDADNPFYGWTYWAVTPGARMDQAGQMMEAQVVQAECGPLPLHAPGETPPKVTDRPFPGLKLVRDNCQAQDRDAVKRALQLSASLGNQRTLKWVRDDP